MSTSLLVTKLYLPPPRANLVPRPRLVDRLRAGLEGPLTLIAAPAGYGKTTLLGEWRAETGKTIPVAWVSLDSGDNDLLRFLLYLTAAIDTVQPDLLGNTGLLLQSPQLPSIETICTALINELSAFPKVLILVLDDYHTITNLEIHAVLAFLLDHLPPHLHLAILTRADPPLPLARLRANGQLTEIRATDLRFTTEEAGAFLNNIMGMKLSTQEVSVLDVRTEGWIAGLQLAALSMEGREDIAKFITAFSGSHQYIVDYLTEEILNRQPEEIRDFLLRTSILERLSGPLCDAVIGDGEVGKPGIPQPSNPPIPQSSSQPAFQHANSQSLLEYLQAANLFLIPLDNERGWFRYHHLFADLLRNRLKTLQGDHVPDLLRRASKWCAQQGLMDEAITYALHANDVEQAVALLERYAATVIEQGRVETMEGWISALPEEIIVNRPRLGLSLAWAVYSDYKFDQSEVLVDQIEQNLTLEGKQLFQGELALWQGIIARRHCDPKRSQDFLQEALDYLPVEHVFFRGRAWIFMGLTCLESNVNEALEAFHQAVRIFETANQLDRALPALYRLVWAQVLQGALTEAEWNCQRALQIAEQIPHWPVGGYAHFAAAELFCERNELTRAAQHADRATELAHLAGHSDNLLIATLDSARIARASGDRENAQDLMVKAIELARPTIPWMKMQVADEQVSLYLANGQVNQAAEWLKWNRTPPHLRSKIPWLQEQINWARVRVAQGEEIDVLDQLAELREQVQDLGLHRWVIQIDCLQALALLTARKAQAALNKLKSAIALAEPENSVQVFLDIGQPFMELLRLAQKNGTAAGFVERLESAFRRQNPEVTIESVPSKQALIAPLSERELEVLTLIASGLSNKAIATELVIALGTVKRHTVNIFNKLDVQNRTEAVAKARELGLL